MVRVQADRDVCISAGNCVMAADAVFDQDDDGIVVVLVDEVPAAEALLAAVPSDSWADWLSDDRNPQGAWPR